MVTVVVASAGACAGVMPEMNIAWPYWNGRAFDFLPELTLVTVTSTDFPVSGWLGVMLGEMQTTWLKLVETTWAWSAPKSTWTGYWNPFPVMVTRVPPSSGPMLGVRT